MSVARLFPQNSGYICSKKRKEKYFSFEKEIKRAVDVYPWIFGRSIKLGWKEWTTPMLPITEHMIFEYVVCLIWASWPGKQ